MVTFSGEDIVKESLTALAILGGAFAIVGGMFGGIIYFSNRWTEKEEKNFQKDKFLLEGIVYDERYMPATSGRGCSSGRSSRYSFSMDTESGRKSVSIERCGCIKNESLDAMINQGTKVQIGIYKNEKNNQNYEISSKRIKVIGEEK